MLCMKNINDLTNKLEYSLKTNGKENVSNKVEQDLHNKIEKQENIYFSDNFLIDFILNSEYEVFSDAPFWRKKLFNDYVKYLHDAYYLYIDIVIIRLHLYLNN